MMESYDSVIEAAIFDHLNAWPDKPCPVTMEFPKRAPIRFAMAMQQLSGTTYLRRYIDGSFIGAWPFAVLVRFTGVDDAKRLEASGILNSLFAWLQQTAPPEIGEGRISNYFEMTALPSCAAQYEDGTCDYQAVYRLIYKKRSV